MRRFLLVGLCAAGMACSSPAPTGAGGTSSGAGAGSASGSGTPASSTGTTAGPGSSAGTGGTSSAGGTGSGGATTGKPDTGDAGCVVGAGALHELDACSPGGQNPCGCGMQCAADSLLNSGTGCEFSCSTSADCPDPKTSCQAGVCHLVGCGEGNNGNVGEACTADSEADGTCYGAISGEGGGNLGLCVRDGTSSGPCLWPSPSSPPALTCPAGQICGTFFDTTSYLPLTSDSFQNPSGNIPPGAYDGMCVPICSQTVSCPPTMNCGLQNLGQTEFASGCTINAGATCDSGGAGAREFEGCGQNSDCNCPLNCVSDPLYGPAVKVCEGSCLQDTDCPSAGDACVAGNCTFRLCGVLPDGGSVPGSPADAPCDALATQDGTCVPSFTGLQLSNLDICYLGGTATGACDVLARYDAGSLCTVGSFCIGGQCLQLCDPSANACPAGATCVRPNDNPTAGVCVGP